MRRVVLVYVGGGAGAALRALLLAALAGWDHIFPASVLIVNLLGAFVLGVAFVLADEAGLLRAETRLFLAVGLLGGFTTFSTFAWGADSLIGNTSFAAAAAYVGASVVGGVLAVGLGLAAAREAGGLLERAAIGVPRRLNTGGQRRHGRQREDVRRDMASIEAEDREDQGGRKTEEEQSAQEGRRR